MLRQLSTLFALLFAYGIAQIGHSAISSLVTYQGGERYNFSDFYLGAMLTANYIGFFSGNYVVRYLLPRISYIRAYSVCAAGVAIFAVCYPIFPHAETWLFMRFLHGLFFSSLVVICDGWLNGVVPNENRSRMYAVYMIIGYICFGIGQYILAFGNSDLGAIFAFSLITILFVASLLPVCLTRFPEPQFVAHSSNEGTQLTMRQAYRIAPVAFVGQIFVGMIQGASFLVVRYLELVANTPQQIANLAVVFFGCGFVLQFPAGWLFDRMQEKRYLLVGVYAVSAAAALVLFFGEYLPYGVLFVLLILYGSVSVLSFSLNIVYGQNYAGADRASAYAGRIYQMYAVGAIIGPSVAGFLMDELSLATLFGFFFVTNVLMVVFTISAKLAPKRKPKPEAVPAASHAIQSPHVPPIDDEPVYTEYDVGPDLPADAVPDAASAPAAADIGPPTPTEAKQSTARTS